MKSARNCAIYGLIALGDTNVVMGGIKNSTGEVVTEVAISPVSAVLFP
jgi:hypothetical protein